MDDFGDDTNDGDDDHSVWWMIMATIHVMVMVMMATLVQWTWTSESLKRILAKRSKKPPRDGDGLTHHLLQ